MNLNREVRVLQWRRPCSAPPPHPALRGRPGERELARARAERPRGLGHRHKSQYSKYGLAGVPKRCMPQIVAEGNRFGEVLIQMKRLGDGSRDLRDLEGMRESRAVVIARGGKEHLGFVLEAAECGGVDDALAVALIYRPRRAFFLGEEAPATALRNPRRTHIVAATLPPTTPRSAAFVPRSPTRARA